MPGGTSGESRGRDERVDEVLADYLRRVDAGEPIDPEAFIAQYPDLETSLREFLDNLRGVNLLVAPALRQDDRPAQVPFGDPSPASCHNTDSLLASDAPDTDHPRQTDREHLEPIPERIGRFQIERLLGSGGFGSVYLARDTQLDRQVALKVPRAGRFPTDQEIERLMEEARAAAQLNHPGLVTIHDVGRDGERVFIVQEFIAGADLGDRLQRGALPLEEIAELTAQVAEAISSAHQKGFVHRDLKPRNILLDEQGRPLVADFGLAVHETLQRRRKGERSGTPAYMSPEQVRGETHRLDGRSDIWSLGVMLYEMLSGRRPFAGATTLELYDEIEQRDPRPPRQICPHVPIELERICLKCLSKRAVDRYSSATDLVADLRHWLAEQRDRQPPAATSTRSGIVPKGLRSFDAEDADFFLDLLPGPRDRDGLPESIRFWKARIESTDAEGSFSVGLIYGPSGCGKSSLIKAGLLPRLAPHVVPVYLEATPEDTELQLLRGLRRRFAAIPPELALPEVLTGIREGLWTPEHTKVCAVLDQFEQWLHAHRGEQETQLIQALRHCDGVRLQCIVLVRDDFWLAASRFSRAVEVEFMPGQNSALVDLFDPCHTRKVLAAFGRAYGRLPEGTVELSKEQELFLDRAVEGLTQDGKIICVRLALFADMLKGKPWTPATLSHVGGTEGLGVTFLEETFSASTAPAAHRYHQQAAQAVLKALLPEVGSDIKGSRQSYEALLAASGYAQRPHDFEALIRILDTEIRLITPTVPVGEDVDAHGPVAASEPPKFAAEPAAQPEKFYQLTHDYLVPSLRDWLTRKQKETRRGRAELKLAERASLWNAKSENRHLPSLWEFGSIRLLTRRNDWTEPQRRMMYRVGKVQGVRWSIALVMMLVLGFGIERLRQRSLSERLRTAVARVDNSRGTSVPLAIRGLEEFRKEQVRTVLNDEFLRSSSAGTRLSLAYALASVDQVERQFLLDAISTAPSEEVDNIVAALKTVAPDVQTDLRIAASAAAAEQAWKAKARLATVATHLNDLSIAAEMLHAEPTAGEPRLWDPTQRTTFIEHFPTWCGDLERLARVLGPTNDASLRSGICLAVGSVKEPAVEVKQAWKDLLTKWYVDQPDAGTHSASGWVLGTWNLPLPAIHDKEPRRNEFHWRKTTNGLTMIRIPASSVNDVYENEEGRHVWHLASHEFWLSDREVTYGQFSEFLSDKEAEERYEPEGGRVRFNAGDPLLPVSQVSWYEAVMFCNWLSRQEGFDTCYRKDGKEKFSDLFGGHGEHEAWKFDPTGTGYRLPTQHEWEYACRARTITKFYFGDDATLLDRYEAYSKNSIDGPFVGGRLMCNAWGLFDMLGNEQEWCQDTFEDASFGRMAIYLGGDWRSKASECRPDCSANIRAIDGQFVGPGFRVAQNAEAKRDRPASEPAGISRDKVAAVDSGEPPPTAAVDNETYSYEGGVFSKRADAGARWTESKTDGSASYDFDETRRDQDWIYLFDPARQMSLRLPVSGGPCFWSMDGGATWQGMWHVSVTH